MLLLLLLPPSPAPQPHLPLLLLQMTPAEHAQGWRLLWNGESVAGHVEASMVVSHQRKKAPSMLSADEREKHLF
jgi:hypothetical protein